jgi:hypothetical protein
MRNAKDYFHIISRSRASSPLFLGLTSFFPIEGHTFFATMWIEPLSPWGGGRENLTIKLSSFEVS